MLEYIHRYNIKKFIGDRIWRSLEVIIALFAYDG